MQNYIYRSYTAALDAQVGQFNLHICRKCGFAYNATFDSDLLSYDENYDNNISSSIFLDYYKEIASFLYEKFSLANGLVVDIGCGKGTFLKVLCSVYPNVQGLGIDPSYESNSLDTPMPNLTFVQDIFKEEHITQKPSLIVCRHVLEHMEYPVSFLQTIRSAASSFTEIPFFIEVPDLDWIIENGAFWDFCYEHCNYFTLESLRNTLELAGFQTEQGYKAFGGQYLWMCASIKSNSVSVTTNEAISGKVAGYAFKEDKLMSEIRAKLVKFKTQSSKIAVWGMATKGVVFCNLIDPDKQLIDFCIDINANKHNCFVPHTGHLISAPESLKAAEKADLMVVVMNANYVDEIKETCQSLQLNAEFIDASGSGL